MLLWQGDRIQGSGVLKFEPTLSVREIGEALRQVVTRASIGKTDIRQASSLACHEGNEAPSALSDAPEDPVHGGVDGILERGAVQYEGDWDRGMIHGQGTMIFTDGSKYTGHWSQNVEQGKGTRWYLTGEVCHPPPPLQRPCPSKSRCC